MPGVPAPIFTSQYPVSGRVPSPPGVVGGAWGGICIPGVTTSGVTCPTASPYNPAVVTSPYNNIPITQAIMAASGAFNATPPPEIFNTPVGLTSSSIHVSWVNPYTPNYQLQFTVTPSTSIKFDVTLDGVLMGTSATNGAAVSFNVNYTDGPAPASHMMGLAGVPFEGGAASASAAVVVAKCLSTSGGGLASAIYQPPTSFDLQYRVHGTGPWTTISGLTGTATTVTGLAPSTEYDFQMQSVNGAGAGGYNVPFTSANTATNPASVADLWFGPTPGFVDFTVESNRRNFISAAGGTQNLGASGQNPFGITPPVFLSSNGTPSTFAANNGRGGPFIVAGTALTSGATNPPGSSSTVLTSVAPSPGQGVLGDYLTGNLYAFNEATYTDNGTPRKWLRRWRALPAGQFSAVKFNWLAIDMETGVVPDGTNPQVVLRWSDDGGHTWSDPRIVAAGQKGQTAFTIKFNRLGMTRRFSGSDRIFELSSSDPFKVAILDADVEVA